MNVSKLIGKMAEKGMSRKVLAESIGVSQTKLYRMTHGGEARITIGEITAIRDALGLTDSECMEIFLP